MFEIVSRAYGAVEVFTGGEVVTSSKDDSSSRQVFIFDTFVVKFDGSNKWQNKRELHFYNNVLEEEDAQFFPKLLGHGIHNGEMFLIQERVDHTEIPTEEHEEQFQYLQTKYGLDDIDVRKPNQDVGWLTNGYVCNCAITKDGLKIYDIGINQNDWCDNDSSESYPSYNSPDCSCSDCRY